MNVDPFPDEGELGTVTPHERGEHQGMDAGIKQCRMDDVAVGGFLEPHLAPHHIAGLPGRHETLKRRTIGDTRLGHTLVESINDQLSGIVFGDGGACRRGYVGADPAADVPDPRPVVNAGMPGESSAGPVSRLEAHLQVEVVAVDGERGLDDELVNDGQFDALCRLKDDVDPRGTRKHALPGQAVLSQPGHIGDHQAGLGQSLATGGRGHDIVDERSDRIRGTVAPVLGDPQRLPLERISRQADPGGRMVAAEVGGPGDIAAAGVDRAKCRRVGNRLGNPAAQSGNGPCIARCDRRGEGRKRPQFHHAAIPMVS